MTKRNFRIGLLLCDDVDPEFQAEHGTYVQFFTESMARVDNTLELVPFRCMEDEFPTDINDFDGYLISGSRHGVYDGYPWIDKLMEFVRQCWQAKTKVVGICFGHQLIAKALGGVAEKAEAGWGFGVHRSFLAEQPSWMSGDAEKGFNLIVIHQDQVIDLPDGFTTLAQNDFCPHSVISDNQYVLGIQGHPEFPKSFCAFRASYRRETIGEEIYAKTISSLDEMALDADRALGWIRDFFRYDPTATAT